MRYAMTVVATLLVLGESANASKIELSIMRFDMRTDRLEFRHYPGGRSTRQVKADSRATFVSNASFFGKKKIGRAFLSYQVDLYIKDRTVIVPSLPKRPVLAVYSDNTVKIFPSYQAMLPWGLPKWAIGGMRIPPSPEKNYYRQFIAVKGHYYFRVVVKGTANSCAWLAHKWGFETILHLDGGSSLSLDRVVPSHLLVFANGIVAGDFPKN